MNIQHTDIVIIGAGPVGLMCAYLARLCGLSVVIADKTSGPLEVGRSDAANARTLQLYEIAGLFEDLYPQGKYVNTSSVWADGKFVSRQSTWWEELEGCFHKHFLMLGQANIEQLLVQKLAEQGVSVKRACAVQDIQINERRCITTFANGDKVKSRYVIGADGSRSFVRNHFNINFDIIRPEIIWAVIDGAIESDFEKVPDIIVFQAETADVAWIPREKDIDRFYIRMDKKEFSMQDAIARINVAMAPRKLSFKRIDWFSQFSVKEAVAEKYFVHDKVFLAGDACHVHSVNGGQGLNTGLGDAFNLIWKINMVMQHGASTDLLHTYEIERQAVARGVIDTSATLVRSTKFSDTNTHATDYVKILEKRAGYITGMGVRYAGDELRGNRLYDFKIKQGGMVRRIYSLLDYSRYSLLVFDDADVPANLPENVQVLRVNGKEMAEMVAELSPYRHCSLLVRPDAYIDNVFV